MTAATITTQVSNKQYVPGQEVVVLTCTDGETYTAKTLSTVSAAQATFMEDMGASTAILSVGISATTVTVYCSQVAVTDKLICLVLYGN